MTHRGVLLMLFVIMLSSCEQSTVGTNSESLPAPSRDLPASEIMKIEGITSAHYTEYYQVTVNGQADTGFSASWELHIDPAHERFNQYYLGTPDWNITVYDLQKGLAWNYYNHALTYPQLPDLKRAYEQNVQAFLGSWLKGTPTYVRSEYVNDKLCDVFTDSTGMLEWVWPEHRLPIQRRVETSHQGIHQIGFTQHRDIQINVAFPKSLFEPPQ